MLSLSAVAFVFIDIVDLWRRFAIVISVLVVMLRLVLVLGWCYSFDGFVRGLAGIIFGRASGALRGHIRRV
jgi:hypothetical protein